MLAGEAERSLSAIVPEHFQFGETDLGSSSAMSRSIFLKVREVVKEPRKAVWNIILRTSVSVVERVMSDLE